MGQHKSVNIDAFDLPPDYITVNFVHMLFDINEAPPRYEGIFGDIAKLPLLDSTKSDNIKYSSVCKPLTVKNYSIALTFSVQCLTKDNLSKIKIGFSDFDFHCCVINEGM